ncbi:MAG: glutamine--scyllo-inositol transaminase [Candidatus Magnetoglobus multicellularis str. Araruama]|uniref:GDP-perosamine synthase n=1 Tax=Candidatus Magnetoglobus multicellularis str. Araruama TaxID=890399 RepID=A0A1V1P7C6_9BACT|nr:MAG: glutamine--scyllo-inositol transaminase [Candidatus Magnetoglobus multicellularis str. Araruama]
MIPVNTPLLGNKEKEYLNQCIETGWISSEGPFVKLFERQMADRIGRKHGIAVCNGTAALDIAVKAVGIGQGDEVIMPSFTIISCASAIIRSNAMPVLVDSEPDTWNMNIQQIENKISPKTKAIMVVHIYGLPVDMNPILELAQKYNLMIIEDAAEMHGQTYHGKACGSFGDISTFSFYSNKNVTTGEGGMILTDSDELADKCKSYRNLCFQSSKRFVHEELGWNYRMTNLQAAVGIAQLEKLDDTVKIKRHIGKKYTALLNDINEFQLPLANTTYAENIYWVYAIVLTDESPFEAQWIINRLAEKKLAQDLFSGQCMSNLCF